MQRYIHFLRNGSDDPMIWVLDNAPEDDEAATFEEDARVAEAWEEIRRGEAISVEEAKRVVLG